MKIPEKFKTLSDHERRVYANKKKAEYEKKLKFWTRICQKLSSNKDFTPLEMDIIDVYLEKEHPTVKDYSTVKFEGGKIVEKLKKE